MIASKAKLSKIKKLIDSRYAQLAITILGSNIFSSPELKTLAASGVDVSNKYSLLDVIYMHYFLNTGNQNKIPSNLRDMIKQQVASNKSPNVQASSRLNEDMKEYIDKMAVDVSFRINGIIKGANSEQSMFNVVINPEKTTVAKLKQELKDTSKSANRDWERVALTEISNSVGLGSAEKIVEENDGNISDVYVYRLTVTDNITCQWCKKFYGQTSPKVYKLSTLMANGSNYGKNKNDWQPVVGATHPNTRTSPIIELKPGFILGSDRNPTFVGIEAQKEWLKNNVNT